MGISEILDSPSLLSEWTSLQREILNKKKIIQENRSHHRSSPFGRRGGAKKHAPPFTFQYPETAKGIDTQ
jgi:hypothetical protein